MWRRTPQASSCEAAVAHARCRRLYTDRSPTFRHAKTISADCTEPALREQVIQSATQTAFATSELVACTRVVVPTIEYPPSHERLAGAARNVERTVDSLLTESRRATDHSATGAGAENLSKIHEGGSSRHGLASRGPVGGCKLVYLQQDRENDFVICSSNLIIS